MNEMSYDRMSRYISCGCGGNGASFRISEASFCRLIGHLQQNKLAISFNLPEDNIFLNKSSLSAYFQSP